ATDRGGRRGRGDNGAAEGGDFHLRGRDEGLRGARGGGRPTPGPPAAPPAADEGPGGRLPATTGIPRGAREEAQTDEREALRDGATDCGAADGRLEGTGVRPAPQRRGAGGADLADREGGGLACGPGGPREGLGPRTPEGGDPAGAGAIGCLKDQRGLLPAVRTPATDRRGEGRDSFRERDEDGPPGGVRRPTRFCGPRHREDRVHGRRPQAPRGGPRLPREDETEAGRTGGGEAQAPRVRRRLEARRRPEGPGGDRAEGPHGGGGRVGGVEGRRGFLRTREGGPRATPWGTVGRAGGGLAHGGTPRGAAACDRGARGGQAPERGRGREAGGHAPGAGGPRGPQGPGVPQEGGRDVRRAPAPAGTPDRGIE